MIKTLNKALSKKYETIEESMNKSKISQKYFSLAFRTLINFSIEKRILRKSQTINIKTQLKLKKYNIDTFVPSENKIKKFIENVRKYDLNSYIFVRILLESGLRTTEIKHFISNFNKNKVEIYDEIIVYPLFHIRGNKNSYYLFMKSETYKLFLENNSSLKQYSINKLRIKIKRKKLLSLKYLRKYHFTQMIKVGIDMEIANFIQGRISQNVGFNHYLVKKEIAIKEYEKL